jgi:hypothetical protein
MVEGVDGGKRFALDGRFLEKELLYWPCAAMKGAQG